MKALAQAGDGFVEAPGSRFERRQGGVAARVFRMSVQQTLELRSRFFEAVRFVRPKDDAVIGD